MAEIVAFRAPRPGEPTVAELTEQVGVLAQLVIELAVDRDRLRERLAELEARLPPPKFELPKGWLAIKQAGGICGVPEPTLYRWTRRGKIMSVKRGFRVFIDPNDKEINRLVTRERAS